MAADLARDLATAAQELAAAASTATTPGAATTEASGPMIVIRGQNGSEIVLRNVDPAQLASLAAAAPTPQHGPSKQEMVMMLASGALAFALCYPLVKALASRLARPAAASPRVSPEQDTRLARIEAAVEATALEVERISEGQRFTTRLLSERSSVAPAPVFVAAPPDAVPVARTP
ncbi:MAG: hypothetical protein MUE41_06660 [Gemmatimonadaceae bacterium]|nr:hypothetical protein [Gemmatimonadaceae bacterium]